MLALPMARGEETFQQAGARLGAVAFLALVAALVLGWTVLVPVAVALAGGLYASELAIADAPLDVAAPAVATGLFLCAELAYWSLEERQRWSGDTGDGLKRATVVALFGAAAFLVAAGLLAVVDAVRARGLAFDLLGTAAAASAIVTLLVVARPNRQPRSGA